jgi:hypothetical protein
LRKIYGESNEPEKRYSPAVWIGCKKEVVFGESPHSYTGKRVPSEAEREMLPVFRASWVDRDNPWIVYAVRYTFVRTFL